MKLGTLSRVLKETLAKSSKDPLPGWVDAFLEPVNAFIEKVGQALQNRLTFEDNFFCKPIRLAFDSGVDTEVNGRADFSGNSRVYGVLLVASNGAEVSSFVWSQKSNGNIAVTITFLSATSAQCELLLLLR